MLSTAARRLCMVARGTRLPAIRTISSTTLRNQATSSSSSININPRFPAPSCCQLPSSFQRQRRQLCASSKVTSDAHLLQELPSRKFWVDTFPDLVAMSGQEGSGKPELVKWIKKPREAVKKGDILFELEVSGSVLLEMRAEVDGFLGPQLVPEGTFLENGHIATYVTKEPEKMPEVSRETEAELLDRAGGSVAELKQGLEEIQAKREEYRSAIVYAMRLTAVHCVCDPASTAIAVRVPGESEHMFAQPYVMFPQEMTKAELLEVDISSGAVVGTASGQAPSAAGSKGLIRFQDVLSAVLRARHDVDCVILAQPTSVTTLGMIKTPGVADIFGDKAAVSLELASVCASGGEMKIEEAALVKAMKGRHAVILPGFGVLVVGRTVAQAYTRLVAMEKNSKLTLGALRTGAKLDEIIPLHDSWDAEIDFAALVRAIKKSLPIARVTV